jgi:isoleucyl-tRNA synthetase
MDLVREICSVALFIRDKKNLRVRLPLKQIRIIGKDTDSIAKHQAIIADEINVKDVVFEKNFDNFASFVLEVDLKKLGIKYGAQLKEINQSVRSGQWKLTNDNRIEIAGVVLEIGEFTLKLKSKIETDSIAALSNNKILVELDCVLTKELELEGIARDLVRIIQQNRKDSNFDVADKIILNIKTSDQQTLESIKNNRDYIQNQTLAKELNLVEELTDKIAYENNLNSQNIGIGLKVI